MTREGAFLGEEEAVDKERKPPGSGGETVAEEEERSKEAGKL
jgi:hypothetical protein